MRTAPVLMLVVHAALAAMLGACEAVVPRAFQPAFPDNVAAATRRVLSRIDGPRAAPEPGWMIATTATGAAAILRIDPGSGEILWLHPRNTDIRPIRLGDLVLAEATGIVFAVSFDDGAPRFELNLGSRALVGMARDGDQIAIVSRSRKTVGSTGMSTLSVLDATDGSVLWEHSVSGDLGAPAAAGGLILVPWQQQALVVLDARNGDELARLRSTDDVFRWIRIEHGLLLAGDLNIRAIDSSYDGTHDPDTETRLPLQHLPALTTPYPLAIQRLARPPHSVGRLSVEFSLELVDGRMTLARDRLYQVFYRHVIAVDADGRLRWARVMDHDVVGAHAGPAGLTVAMQDGSVALLALADGRPSWRPRGERQLSAAALGGEWLSGARSERSPPRDATTELHAALLEMALDSDDRLLGARAFAVRQLATAQQADATRDLLDVYRQLSTTPELRKQVAHAIIGRRSGSEFLLAALEVHRDFLDGTDSPRLEVLAPALKAMGETRAVTLLARHLLDPGTPVTSLAAIVDAMATLDPVQARPVLWRFLRRYHADSALGSHRGILVATARAILTNANPAQAAALAQLAEHAPSALAADLHDLLSPSAGTSIATADAATGGPRPARTPDRSLPLQLPRAAIHAVFSSHIDDLRMCAKQQMARDPGLSQIRITFILSPDGGTHARGYLPDTPEFVACLDPLVANYRFGQFTGQRQTTRYVVALQDVDDTATTGSMMASATGNAASASDWWMPQSMAASQGGGLPGPRWWHDRNALMIRMDATVRLRDVDEASDAQASLPTGKADATGAAGAGMATKSAERLPKVNASDPSSNGTPAPKQAPTDAWWRPVRAVSPATRAGDSTTPPQRSAPP